MLMTEELSLTFFQLTIKTLAANQNPHDFKKLKHLKWQMKKLYNVHLIMKQNIGVHWLLLSI